MDISQQNIVYCKKHSKHLINFINISKENLEELSCEECMMEEGQTIQVCEDNHVFSNWPPVQDSQLLKEIQSTLKLDSLTIDLLEEQFQQIIIEMTDKLYQVKKKMIQSIVRQDEHKEQLLKCYNEISGKQKLKDVTKFKKQNFENQFEDLKSFVSQIHKQRDQNTSSLKESLLKYKNSLLSLSEISLPKQSILDQVEIFCQDINLIIQKQSILLEQQQSHNDQSMHLSQLFGKNAFCNLLSSNKIQVLENKSEGKISIKKYQNISGQIYFNNQLNKQKNYTFRFKFNDKAGSHLIIGLIEENITSQWMANTYNGKIFQSNSKFYGGKIIKGNHFNEIEKDFLLEMRIDIQNGQIQYLDYPNYNNINQLNQGQILDQNKNYFLAIELYESFFTYETCIDLIYFEEINK